MCVVQLHLEVNSESSYVARALQICPGDVKSYCIENALLGE